MKTEEVIEKVKGKYEYWQGYTTTQEEADQVGEERDKVIGLLKDGDKYKKIVEETDKAIQPGAVNYIPENMLRMDQISIMRYVFKKIKESHFPKLVKQYITIEVEAKTEMDVDSGMRMIKELVDNMGCPKMKIANEWKEE